MRTKINGDNCTIFVKEEINYVDAKIVAIENFKTVTLDFKDIDTAHSNVFNMMVYVKKNFNGKIFLVNMSDHILEQLKTLGILSFFDEK